MPNWGCCDIVVLSIAAAYRLPTLYHLHFGRLPEVAQKGGWEWRLIRRSIRLADQVIALDRATLSTLPDHSPEKESVCIPNRLSYELWSKGPQPAARQKGRTAGSSSVLCGWILRFQGNR